MGDYNLRPRIWPRWDLHASFCFSRSFYCFCYGFNNGAQIANEFESLLIRLNGMDAFFYVLQFIWNSRLYIGQYIQTERFDNLTTRKCVVRPFTQLCLWQQLCHFFCIMSNIFSPLAASCRHNWKWNYEQKKIFKCVLVY